MNEKLVFNYQISLKKQQFVITHTNRQTEIAELLHG
jgi:hypothetical protein